MKIQITDAELPIMQLLWQKAPQTSPELLAQLDGNISTQKTLLKRLTDRGMVLTDAITSRAFQYRPAVSQQEYQNTTSQNFLKKVFDGSSKKMLLSFIQEEQITKSDLQELLQMIEEG